MDPFVWGQGGRPISPEERGIAQSLVDMSPIVDPMQGFARMAQAGVDRYNAMPQNYFPSQPGGNTFMGGLQGLGSRLLGGGGGLF